jgi:DamX protein
LNTKIIKHAGMSVLALGIVFALGACSSKPSPWSQQASPWDNRQDSQAEAEPLEIAEEEQSPFVNDAAEVESSGIEEPVGLEEGAAFEEPEPVAEEPMMEEAMAEEAEMVAEPVASGIGGDINSQPPGHYALQVVASSNMGNLKAFAERHQISDEWVAETTVNGKVWFVLLQGIYPTMDEAKVALEQASAGLDTSPWVRSVGSLQAVMIQ